MPLCGRVDADRPAGDVENPEPPTEQPACVPLKKLLRIQSAPARDDNTLPAFEPPVERTESAPAGAMDVEGGAEGDAEDDGPVRYHSMSDNERASFHRLKTMVKVMDNGFTVPVVQYKVGMDAVVGLVPYAGDVSGAMVGTYIMSKALRYHLPRRTLVRMMVNQAIDSIGGICPLLGDFFDATYKANHKNLLLVEEHLKNPERATIRDCCFLTSLFFFVVVLPLTLVLSLLGGIIVAILAAFGVIR